MTTIHVRAGATTKGGVTVLCGAALKPGDESVVFASQANCEDCLNRDAERRESVRQRFGR